MADYADPNLEAVELLGKTVRRLRTEAGLSQDVLSERCGIYRTYLSRIECGQANPSLIVLFALATTLGVDMLEMLRGE